MTREERYEKFKDIISNGDIKIITPFDTSLSLLEELVTMGNIKDMCDDVRKTINGDIIVAPLLDKIIMEVESEYQKATIKELYEKYGILLDKDEFQGKDCSTHVEIKFARNHEAYAVPHTIDSIRGVDYNSIYEIIQEKG